MTPSTDYDYDYAGLLKAYSSLGVAPGRCVYVGADLIRLMRYKEPGRIQVLNAHLRAFRELLGPTGTLFVPTASLNLCNSQIVFDPESTPSADMGVFAEYVRQQPDAVRSFHPFWSVTGVGPAAAEFLGKISRHAYGWGSIFQHFVERDVLGVNIGRSAHYSISVIHHIETVIGVPYRYTKEFMHPVLRAGKVSIEPFYLSVLYRECDIVRDRNRKIFENFSKYGTMKTAEIGRGNAWSFSHKQFFDVTTELLQRDIYAWLERPPTLRPYQY